MEPLCASYVTLSLRHSGDCLQVVGIDLGTTNSAVAAMEGGKPTIVTNAEGESLPNLLPPVLMLSAPTIDVRITILAL